MDTLPYAITLMDDAVTTGVPYCGPPSLGIRQLLRVSTRQDVSSWFGSGKICFVHRARTAIRYLPDLLGCVPGDEILAPAYNCGSEIDALIAGGSRVVVYRVDWSGRIDLEDLKQRYSKRTRAVYVIHYFGFPQSIAELREWCGNLGIYLIEDCALSLFSSDGETRLGTLGDAAVFSFPKSLPVPDGGAILINNPRFDTTSWHMKSPGVANIIRDLLPLTKSTILRWVSNFTPVYSALRYLLNWKSTFDAGNGGKKSGHLPDMPPDYYFDAHLTDKDISGLTRYLLRNVDGTIVREQRRKNFLQYRELLHGTDAVPLFVDLPAGVCPLNFPVLVANPTRLMLDLQRKSVAAISWWAGFHKGITWEEFPEARYLKERVLALPVHQDLGPLEVEQVCDTFRKILEEKR